MIYSLLNIVGIAFSRMAIFFLLFVIQMGMDFIWQPPQKRQKKKIAFLCHTFGGSNLDTPKISSQLV